MPRRRTFRRRKGGFRKAVQKIIKSNQEIKTAVFNFPGGTTVGTTGNDSSLVNVAQGDTQQSRDGNQLRLLSIEGDLFLAASDSSNAVRMLLYRQKDASGAAMAIAYDGLPDLDQYVVYRDFLIPLATSGGPGVSRRRFRIKFPASGLRVQYDGTAGTDIVSGYMKMYVVSDSSSAPHPTVVGNVRIRYTDC